MRSWRRAPYVGIILFPQNEKIEGDVSIAQSFLGLTAAALAARAVEPTPGHAFTPKELSGMEGVATAFMNAHAVPGLSVAVVRHGTMLYKRGFGFADRDTNEKVTPDHLFRIASVSKPITSATLFSLMEEKRLTLEDTVFGPGGILGDDFGGPPYKKWVTEIRIKHLLTHTCGGWQNDGSDPMFRNASMNHRALIAWPSTACRWITNPGPTSPIPTSVSAFWGA